MVTLQTSSEQNQCGTHKLGLIKGKKKNQTNNQRELTRVPYSCYGKPQTPVTAFSWLCCSAQPWAASWVLTGCNFWPVKKWGFNLLGRQGWVTLDRFQSPPTASSPSSARAPWGCSGGVGATLAWGAAGGRAAMPKGLARLLPPSCGCPGAACLYSCVPSQPQLYSSDQLKCIAAEKGLLFKGFFFKGFFFSFKRNLFKVLF